MEECLLFQQQQAQAGGCEVAKLSEQHLILGCHLAYLGDRALTGQASTCYWPARAVETLL